MCNLSEMVFEDGMAHGMERGKADERISIVKTQLSMKFKDVSFDWVSDLKQDKLDDIIKHFFDITYEEVMAMKNP